MPAKKPPHAATPVPIEASAPGGGQFIAVRETIESIVVAFALAFLIRTFEAEAFVIPTGSMSPSLLGQHKDVTCGECGYRYRTTASSEDPEEARRRGARDISGEEVLAGMCPMCRYVMPLRPDLPKEVLEELGTEPDDIASWRTYPGDRILVNKFGLDFHDPKRWDVVVFKFPGDGNMNYIKRLTGLPRESLRIAHGDLFVKSPARPEAGFQIERKPPAKLVAMLQAVHDTDFQPATLFMAGWPLRWASTNRGGWQIKSTVEDASDLNVHQTFTIDGVNNKFAEETGWLRYRHLLAEPADWRLAHEVKRTGSWEGIPEAQNLDRKQWQARARPELISDFNPYNARIERKLVDMGFPWGMTNERLGANWVGELALECDVEDAEAKGELLLDLVEAGYHFRATIDLATGHVALGVVDCRTGGPLDFHAEADSPVKGGTHKLRFSNIDEQLLLWVDGKLVDFKDSTYDAEKLFPGGRQGLIPWAGAEGEDQGDLSPAGVGARDAKLAVTRLAVLRDIYYIATDYTHDPREIMFDYASPTYPADVPGYGRIEGLRDPHELFAVSESWPRFLTRRTVEFDLKEDQYFVMGDNSPESKDARLWKQGDRISGIPGGSYLNRRLMIGKAICVFWPHSWGAIPGIPQLPGWPNFRDMRFVK